MDAATHVEVPCDLTSARFQRPDEIVEDAVGDRLVERALVLVTPEVQLEALHTAAGPTGYVSDPDGGEVGLPGHRADAGELRALEPDLVVPAGAGIRERCQRLLRFGDLARCQVGLHSASHRCGAS